MSQPEQNALHDNPVCYTCHEVPLLLTVVEKGQQMYSLGCPKCYYFTGAALTKGGARVAWYRENCKGQSAHNLDLRRKRTQRMREGTLTLEVIKSEPDFYQ